MKNIKNHQFYSNQFFFKFKCYRNADCPNVNVDRRTICPNVNIDIRTIDDSKTMWLQHHFRDFFRSTIHFEVKLMFGETFL